MSRALLAVAVVMVASSSVAHGQLRVRVRAEARIEVRVDRAPGLVTVGGTLRDDLGQPLADREVALRIQDSAGIHIHAASPRTDTRGSFATSLPLETGAYQIVARWAGDSGHRQVEIRQALDLTRAHVRLDVGVADGRLDLDRDTHTLDVRASSEEGGAGLHIDVRNELDRLLAEGTTNTEGRARFSISSAALGPPAAGRMIVHTRGDARRAEAQTEVPIVRFRPIALTLRASAVRIRERDEITLAGTLSTSEAPLARRAVGLFAGDAHLETVLTDEEGRFSRKLELGAEDDSPIVVTARFASDAPWRPSARSEAIEIEIEGTESTPWWWLLAPMIACALALALLARRTEAALTGRAPNESLLAPGIAPGAVSGRSLTHDLGGVVLDANEGTSLAGARIVLRTDDTQIARSTDAAGRFAFDELAEGSWTLEISAPGYAGEAIVVHLPHRGEWSALTVRLQSLREIALARFRPIAEALAPARRWWAFWTPRELADRATTRRDELARLTTAVERAAYAKPTPDEADVAAIAEHARQIEGEIERL